MCPARLPDPSSSIDLRLPAAHHCNDRCKVQIEVIQLQHSCQRRKLAEGRETDYQLEMVSKINRICKVEYMPEAPSFRHCSIDVEGR